ncbi:MAG TPA: serine/threonine-protein kinase [Pirellulaceae bacterium]|nr:serine/threonine-protein kinase [Pirellulaceae bacterium]
MSNFDPYYHWLGIPPKDQPPNHYRLLGIERFEDNEEVISRAADRQMAHVRTFQTGPRREQSQELLNKIAQAFGCLLNTSKRTTYDSQLRKTLAAGDANSSRQASTAQSSDRPISLRTVDTADSFGDYLLLEQIGQSSSGRVFKAQHQTLGRVVALKILAPRATQSADLLERFRRKVRILAGISHPNLLTVYDAGERDGSHFLVMEYVDGTDLRSLSKHYGALPIEHVVAYIKQAAAGLGRLHADGIHHRNVKPSNLLLDQQGVLKVIGLGVARVDTDGEDKLTLAGKALGTYDYMSPEQAIDARNADHRSDIYSLGCTMFRLFTGRVPYPERNPLKKVQAHRQAAIPSIRDLRPDTPALLDEVVQKMMAKLPEDRFQSMSDVIAALR